MTSAPDSDSAAATAVYGTASLKPPTITVKTPVDGQGNTTAGLLVQVSSAAASMSGLPASQPFMPRHTRTTGLPDAEPSGPVQSTLAPTPTSTRAGGAGGSAYSQ